MDETCSYCYIYEIIYKINLTENLFEECDFDNSTLVCVEIMYISFTVYLFKMQRLLTKI